MNKVAVLIDGAFYLKRFAQAFPGNDPKDARAVTESVQAIAARHVRAVKDAQLYRIFWYDSPPLDISVNCKISGKHKSLKKTDTYKFRAALHENLRTASYVALRLGELKYDKGKFWKLKESSLQKLLKGEITAKELADDDFEPNLRQKCVDIKIGLDIASLTYKRFVSQLVLISGDQDFFPAAKLARREGVQVILDTLGWQVQGGLYEHIDVFRTESRSIQNGDE